jgi:hypothetical protein
MAIIHLQKLHVLRGELRTLRSTNLHSVVTIHEDTLVINVSTLWECRGASMFPLKFWPVEVGLPFFSPDN